MRPGGGRAVSGETGNDDDADERSTRARRPGGRRRPCVRIAAQKTRKSVPHRRASAAKRELPTAASRPLHRMRRACVRASARLSPSSPLQELRAQPASLALPLRAPAPGLALPACAQLSRLRASCSLALASAWLNVCSDSGTSPSPPRIDTRLATTLGSVSRMMLHNKQSGDTRQAQATQRPRAGNDDNAAARLSDRPTHPPSTSSSSVMKMRSRFSSALRLSTWLRVQSARRTSAA